MPALPIGAPKPPMFDPSTIIKNITGAVIKNELQLYLVLAIGALVIGFLLYLIWEEYRKHPIKHKSMKWGKTTKLSDLLRKK